MQPINFERKSDGRGAEEAPTAHRARFDAPQRRAFVRRPDRWGRFAGFLLKLRDPLFLLAVLAALGFASARQRFTPTDGGITLFSVFLFLTARQVPIARTREKSLTFLPPVTFAIGLWCGAVPAALAALLTGFLAARFRGDKIPGGRRRARMQGVHLALSVLAANGVFAGTLTLFHIAPAAVTFWGAPLSSPRMFPLVIAAALGAAVFLALLLLLTAAEETGAARKPLSLRRDARVPPQSRAGPVVWLAVGCFSNAAGCRVGTGDCAARRNAFSACRANGSPEPGCSRPARTD